MDVDIQAAPGLNRPATLKLEKVLPLDRSTRLPITADNPDRAQLLQQFEQKLKRRADAQGFTHVSLSDSGLWTLSVKSFDHLV